MVDAHLVRVETHPNPLVRTFYTEGPISDYEGLIVLFKDSPPRERISGASSSGVVGSAGEAAHRQRSVMEQMLQDRAGKLAQDLVARLRQIPEVSEIYIDPGHLQLVLCRDAWDSVGPQVADIFASLLAATPPLRAKNLAATPDWSSRHFTGSGPESGRRRPLLGSRK